MGYNGVGEKWSYELAKERVVNCKEILELDCMPTHVQFDDFYGNQGLSGKLSRANGWKKRIMEELNIEMGKSETSMGWKYEEQAEKILSKQGHKVERMTTGAHFDILVNDSVKIDVKAGRRWYIDDSQVNTFGINKKYATCDIYMMFSLDDKDDIERLLIIPSFLVRSGTMSIGKNSKYDIWKDRFDVVDEYVNFLKQF